MPPARANQPTPVDVAEELARPHPAGVYAFALVAALGAIAVTFVGRAKVTEDDKPAFLGLPEHGGGRVLRVPHVR